jgi:DNA-binding LacI/PurR family transcriptional regulator
MTALLGQNPTITAVVCYNNVVATGAWFGPADRISARWRNSRRPARRALATSSGRQARRSADGDVDLIRPDNMQAAQLVTEHLIRRGHQRIAWLGGQVIASAACFWLDSHSSTHSL